MTPAVYMLDFRERPIGGAVVGPVLYDRDDRLVPEGPRLLKHAGQLVFLLHGFNVRRPDGRQALTDLALLLSAPPISLSATFVGVLWPGDDRLSPLTYSLEERDADQTAARFATVLRDVVRPGAPVHFAAHSLGCRVALDTMRRLDGSSVSVGQVALMAAAVDADALARSDRYRSAVGAAQRVAVLHSTSDLVLRLAFPAGDAFAALLYGGYTSAALGFRGPKPSKSETLPADIAEDAAGAFKVGHGHYLPGRPLDPRQVAAANWTGKVIGGLRPVVYR